MLLSKPANHFIIVVSFLVVGKFKSSDCLIDCHTFQMLSSEHLNANLKLTHTVKDIKDLAASIESFMNKFKITLPLSELWSNTYFKHVHLSACIFSTCILASVSLARAF